MDLIERMGALQTKAFSEKYLLITNISIALLLGLIGDLIEQHFEHISEKANNGKDTIKYDFVRMRNMGLAGCSVDIICHYWYQCLDHYMPGSSISDVLKKIILDQLIITPIYITAFFITFGLLDLETPQDIWNELNTKGVHLYIVECAIWPIAQFINFYWLPCRYRILYDNIFALGFDIYTSHVKHWDRVQTNEIDAGPVSVFIKRLNQSSLNSR